MNEKQIYKYLIDMVKHIEDDENKREQCDIILTQYNKLKSKKNKNIQELMVINQIEKQFNKSIDEYKNRILEMFGQKQISDFITALESKMLFVDTMNIENSNEIFNDEFISEFFKRVSKGLIYENKYPLYNKSTIDLLKTAISEGEIDVPRYINNNIKTINIA